jgi:hypothetical protein
MDDLIVRRSGLLPGAQQRGFGHVTLQEVSQPQGISMQKRHEKRTPVNRRGSKPDVLIFKKENLEARGRIEPPYKGFADLYRRGLNPSVYAGCVVQTAGFGPTI